LTEESAVFFANEYAHKHKRLPNIFLCSYPDYPTAEHFFSIRPFFRLAKGKGVEVGTFEGYNAVNVFKYCNIDKLYCVDPFVPYVDIVGGLGKFSQEAFDAIHDKVVKRIKPNGEVIRKASLDAVGDFTDNSLDFVYLDGDHSRQNVLNEINSWLTKIKVGGVLGGHDHSENGVLGALTEWNLEHLEYDQNIIISWNDWWLVKI
jgi:hypothetical protein